MDHGNAGCIIPVVKIDTFRKLFENIASQSEVAIRIKSNALVGIINSAKLVLVFTPGCQDILPAQILRG